MKFLYLLLTVLLFSCSSPANKATNNKTNPADTCCVKDTASNKTLTAMQSVITCPKCRYQKTETMPTDVCLLKYTCTNCKAGLRPKHGDCCVFCTYGTHKCPSMQ